MTAEDIRCVVHNEVRSNPTSTGSTLVLVEIAAQLASLNATLKVIADVVHADWIAKYGK